ncbi:MAG: hypothetical protein Q7U48_04740 [Hydrogenophaga sp.]|nr:hypothetical protein [Hydrogenophaga sp.]
MTNLERRLSQLEVTHTKVRRKALSDAERAVRLAALKPGTPAYSKAWAIVLGHTKHDQNKKSESRLVDAGGKSIVGG